MRLADSILHRGRSAFQRAQIWQTAIPRCSFPGAELLNFRGEPKQASGQQRDPDPHDNDSAAIEKLLE